MERTKIEWVMCHRKPERSFFWKGKQFPFCARCTGIYLGYLSIPVFIFVTMNLWLSLLLIVPTTLDGLTQAYFNRESNNILRLITGLMAGIGIISATSLLGKYIGKLILLIIY